MLDCEWWRKTLKFNWIIYLKSVIEFKKLVVLALNQMCRGWSLKICQNVFICVYVWFLGRICVFVSACTMEFHSNDWFVLSISFSNIRNSVWNGILDDGMLTNTNLHMNRHHEWMSKSWKLENWIDSSVFLLGPFIELLNKYLRFENRIYCIL